MTNSLSPWAIKCGGKSSRPMVGSFTENHRPLDHVFELANVARPVMAFQRCQCLRLNAFQAALGILAELLDEMIHQEGNIFASLTQRRQLDANDIHPIE